MNRVGHSRRFTLLRGGIAGIAIVVVLFYAAAGYMGSARMFGDHPRWRGMNRGPADFGLTSQTLSFHSQDGIPLRAWWLPASGKRRGLVIVSHGIDHTRQVMLPRAEFLVRGGYDVLSIDLRGHGESGGTVVSPGLLEAKDILGVLGFAHSLGGNEPIAVLGVSYGAVASLIAASQSGEIAAVIGDGPFTNGKDVSEDIRNHYLEDPQTSFWMRGLFLGSSFPGVTRAIALTYYLRTGIYLGPELVSVIPLASRLRVPVLLVSGERDWIVPTARTRQILKQFRATEKSLW